MLFCVLNKYCKGILNDKNVFESLVKSDINSEYYVFRDNNTASEFMANYHLDITNTPAKKSNREYALELLDNRSNIIYMTCVPIKRISGYAFGFLVKSKDKYDFYMHTIPLEKNRLKAFQEAYLNLISSIKVKKQIFILTDSTKLIEEFTLASKTQPPLKSYQTFYTNDFINVYRTCPVIFSDISSNNTLDYKILAALYKKVQLIYAQRVSKDVSIYNDLLKIDNILKPLNKIPVLFTNTKLSLINTYKQFHIEIEDEIKIQNDEFKVNDVKVSSLLEVSKDLSNKIDKIESDEACSVDIDYKLNSEDEKKSDLELNSNSLNILEEYKKGLNSDN